jgi:nucleoside 2-deoxyribosyltransferase
LFAAERNITDLDSADVIVVMTTGTPARGGRHFETGYAYASGKPVLIAGPLEHAFHHLPHVEVTEVDKVAERLHALDLIRSTVSDTMTVGTPASTAQAERRSG